MKTVIEQVINARKIQARNGFNEYMEWFILDGNKERNPLVSKKNAEEWGYEDFLCFIEFCGGGWIALLPRDYSGGEDELIALDLAFYSKEGLSVYALVTLQQLFYEIDEEQKPPKKGGPKPEHRLNTKPKTTSTYGFTPR